MEFVIEKWGTRNRQFRAFKVQGFFAKKFCIRECLSYARDSHREVYIDLVERGHITQAEMDLVHPPLRLPISAFISIRRQQEDDPTIAEGLWALKYHCQLNYIKMEYTEMSEKLKQVYHDAVDNAVWEERLNNRKLKVINTRNKLLANRKRCRRLRLTTIKPMI